MRLKNLLSSVCAASIVALSFVGCQDYDNGFTEKQLQFIQNFKEIYGEVDPTQDWNLAERANVTVTVSKPSNIKIYAKESGRYRIVGDYKDVSGTRTLGFDVVEGTKDIMVSDGQTAQKSTVGSSVTFAGTRNIITADSHVTKIDKHAVIDKDTYTGWRKHVPEGKFNLGKVSQDFVFVSTGSFIIYPIYWNTNNANTLGIYYVDTDNSIKEFDIYEIKNYTDEEELLVSWDDGKTYDKPIAYNDMPYKLTWTVDNTVDEGPDYIKAKGIEVNLPKGTVFGMYLRNSKSTYYSNRDRNEDVAVKYLEDDKGVVLSSIVNDYTKKAVHAASFLEDGNMYIGFEDWYNEESNYATAGKYGTGNYCDFDLNDCLFMFGADVPDIVEEGVVPWIISAEDLGNTLDIDYNDVVIEVEYVSGRDYADVTPLAAGGTLASYVYFAGKHIGAEVKGSDGNQKTGEIHELFSNDNRVEKSGEYTPINVWNTTPDEYSKRTYTVEIDDPKNFTLSSYVPDDEKFNAEDVSMGGFKIYVVDGGTTLKGLTEDQIKSGASQKIQNEVSVKDGGNEKNVPYVICTPKYWTRPSTTTAGMTETGHYRWPQESIPMLPTTGYTGAAYNTPGHTFAAWVADKNNSKDWYKYPDTDITCAPSGIGEDTDSKIHLKDPNIRFRDDVDASVVESKTITIAAGSDLNIFDYITSDNENGLLSYETGAWRFEIEIINGGNSPTQVLFYKNNDQTDNGMFGTATSGIAQITIIQNPYIQSEIGNSDDYKIGSMVVTVNVITPLYYKIEKIRNGISENILEGARLNHNIDLDSYDIDVQTGDVFKLTYSDAPTYDWTERTIYTKYNNAIQEGTPVTISIADVGKQSIIITSPDPANIFDDTKLEIKFTVKGKSVDPDEPIGPDELGYEISGEELSTIISSGNIGKELFDDADTKITFTALYSANTDCYMAIFVNSQWTAELTRMKPSEDTYVSISITDAGAIQAIKNYGVTVMDYNNGTLMSGIKTLWIKNE